MDSLGVCPTEEAVQVFLDYLVDPMLPAKSSARDTPLPDQQKLVAKQVHAVGLLYNYYHRKQHPQLEFLDFDSFCKLAAVLKPPLLTFMKLMQRSDDTELDELDKQISITERTIMDACDICNALEASKDVPHLDGWPISKVAVFLVDSGEENCLLQFSSVTQGVWSVIERDIDIGSGHSHSSEDTVEANHKNKKKKITKRSLNASGIGDAELLKLAFSAVKDATGINQTDLLMLERHIVYSLSKEKTAAQFFLMRCTQAINEDVAQVPIKDVIDSLHGPLVKKSTRSWTATPVVEYFHVLPYAGIISQWLSRDSTSNSLQELKVELANVSFNNSVMIETRCDVEVDKNRERSNGNTYAAVEVVNETTGINTSPKQKENYGSCMNGFSNNFSGPNNMDVDGPSVESPKNEEKNKNVPDTTPISLHQEETTPSLGSSQIFSTSGLKVEAKMVDSVVKCTTEHEVEKFAPGNKTCNMGSSDQDGMLGQALITYQSDSNHLHKLHSLLSKKNIVPQTALKFLLRKRDNLTKQQRNIEDEIAQCDQNIQTILSGGEDALALQIESLIEGCNDVCLRSNADTRDRAYQPFEGQVSPQCIKRKRLAEAVLSMENPSQELDSICYKNCWVLPTYRVSTSDGGFQAAITVKGVDFEFSLSGDLHANPREARESAALQMLTKLRSVVGQAH